MKKLVLMLLALVMIVSVFASCKADKSDTQPKATTPKRPVDEGPEEERLNVDIDSIDYNQETVYIFHWEPETDELNEFGMAEEEQENDVVKSAIYKRNLYTERDLGIKLDWYESPGTIFTETRQFINDLEKRASDNTDPVDIIIAQAKSMPYFMIEDKLTELNTYSDSLDLKKAWWPESIQDAFAVKDSLYFVSGDISANLLRMMTVIFVNKATLESIGQSYDELMEKVLAYEWTLDDLITLTEDRYANLDKIPGPSKDDRFGLVTLYFHTDGLYAGLGYKYMEQSTRDDAVLRLSSQIRGETALNYVNKLEAWLETGDFYIDPTEKEYDAIFAEGRSLFILQRAWFGFELQKTDIKFAVLPTPRLEAATNEKDHKYYTTIGNQFSAYGIFKESPDYDRAAQTLQVLGYHAFKETTPALFEVSFQGQHSKDDYAIQMYSIIRESIVFDVGKIYEVLVATLEVGFRDFLITNIVSYAISDGESGEIPTTYTFHSMSDPVRKKVEKQIETANEKILNFLASKS